MKRESYALLFSKRSTDVYCVGVQKNKPCSLRCHMFGSLAQVSTVRPAAIAPNNDFMQITGNTSLACTYTIFQIINREIFSKKQCRKYLFLTFLISLIRV